MRARRIGMRNDVVVRIWACAALCLALVGALGCKVTEDDIETWKGTVKGPRKMLAVVLADKYEMPLRARAALGLVEMERGDVDGVAELQRVIAGLGPSTRTELIDRITPGLVKLMASGGDAKIKSEDGPPAIQIRAKDAAFALITHAGPESRGKLTDGVMRWYIEDFNGRNLSGNYSAEQVVRALGSPAAKILVEAMGARLPQQALIKLAELIGQLGDAKTKQAAGAKLVAIEAEMQGAEFLEWLKKEISQQLEAAGQKADAARIEKTALLNRAKFIDEGVIPAMKYLADQPEVSQRLLAIAANSDPALALRRTRALQALEGKVDEAHLEPLLALALDPKAPASVRDYAFDRVGDIGSPKAIPPMWPLVQDADNQRLRWRAGELVLALGGNSVLSEFFAKLPPEAEYEPEELDGYALRMGQMTPLPKPDLTARLSSPHWWSRVIALYFFQRKGTAADIPKMSRLLEQGDKTQGKKWQEASTVGKVAKQAIDGLRERLGHGQAPQTAQGS